MDQGPCCIHHKTFCIAKVLTSTFLRLSFASTGKRPLQSLSEAPQGPQKLGKPSAASERATSSASQLVAVTSAVCSETVPHFAVASPEALPTTINSGATAGVPSASSDVSTATASTFPVSEMPLRMEMKMMEDRLRAEVVKRDNENKSQLTALSVTVIPPILQITAKEILDYLFGRIDEQQAQRAASRAASGPPAPVPLRAGPHATLTHRYNCNVNILFASFTHLYLFFFSAIRYTLQQAHSSLDISQFEQESARIVQARNMDVHPHSEYILQDRVDRAVAATNAFPNIQALYHTEWLLVSNFGFLLAAVHSL